MNLPLLSVIIPCFNQGRYLHEIIACFPGYHAQNSYELIFVNDGSTDAHTITVLKEVESLGFQVLHQANQGVCVTRNNGIQHAKGKYILPLDGDDLISLAFIYEAIEILTSKPDYTVVYCNGEYFNGRVGPWNIGKFNLQRLMLWNYIPSCAVYRKSAWEKVKGYDPKANGLEDWELWLAIAFSGGKFYYLNKSFFKYRIAPGTATRTTTDARYKELWEYLQEKHSDYFGKEYLSNDFILRFKHNKRLWIKLFFRVYFPNFSQRLFDKGKIDTLNLD